MALRRAQVGDESAVAALSVRSWQSAYRGLLPDAYLDGLDPQERAAGSTFSLSGVGGPVTVVAVEDDAIRGFATTGPSRDADASGLGELYAIYVDPVRWASGVGSALVADARRCLTLGGFAEALLWVLVGNDRAERFYRRDGWRPDGARRLGRVHGLTVDEVRYRRILS